MHVLNTRNINKAINSEARYYAADWPQNGATVPI